MSPIVRKTLIVAAAMALLPIVGQFDSWTGYEVSIFPLYAFLVAWVSWRVDLGWGLVLGLMATAVWIAADRASGHHYSAEWIRWERAGVHVITFGFVAYSFAAFRRNLEREERKVRQLQGILPICIACSRISAADGSWNELDAYLRDHSQAQPQPGLCPDCLGTRFR